MSKVLQERGFGSLPSLTKTNPRDQVKSILTTIEADSYPIRRIHWKEPYTDKRGKTNDDSISKSFEWLLLLRKEGIIWTTISHINNSIPKKEKDPRSFTLPCFINNICFDNALVNLGARVSVMPLSTYLNLGLGELAHT
ncbi:hypothetical protein Tco_1193373 [Tanacetum coccineum]